MRSYGHLWLFIFLGLIGFDGPGANATDSAPDPSDSREAGTPVTVAASAALPACPGTPADHTRAELDGVPTTLATAASVAAPPPGCLRLREAEWLSFRRPFAETVSYRTTAPPSRIA